MKVVIELKMEYGTGRFRKVSWTENNPQVGEEVDGVLTNQRPATIDEVRQTMRKNMVALMNKGALRSFVDPQTGKITIIRFSEVIDLEITVKEVIKSEISPYVRPVK